MGFIKRDRSYIKTADRQSSKGNQLKWYRDDLWYKADYTGYEGLVEYIVSKLLKLSSLKENEICLYESCSKRVIIKFPLTFLFVSKNHLLPFFLAFFQ